MFKIHPCGLFLRNKLLQLNFSYIFTKNYTSTIFALSSGKGKCGVAVIRISGPASNLVMGKMAGLKKLPEPRKALLRQIRHPEKHELLDRGLVLWFPGPNSFTGEDSCELQIHGGVAVISAVLDALAAIPGLRPAEPGEFTKRAFYSNKMDLTEAEGLADLIHAETEAQRKQALLQVEGSLYQRYSEWRDNLKRCIAHVEAYIDFSEDQNIEDDILQTTNSELKLLTLKIQAHLQDGRRGERTRDGVKTVIVGAPNVGKSSLLNALCERPAAIVSATPGTTRDVVSSVLDIAGYPVLISDTAGLRDNTDDVIEREGIARAHQELGTADLMLLVIDATFYQNWSDKNQEQNFLDFLKIYINTLKLEEAVLSCGNVQKLFGDKSHKVTDNVCLIVFNKLDLIEYKSLFYKVCREYPECVTAVSCKDNGLLGPLIEKLTTSLEKLCGNPTRENACLSQSRHRYHLTACVAALDRYLAMCGSEREIDQAAGQLRVAMNAIGHITGHVSTEQILDVIFKDFCIGK
ncbi:tRNA modification GTPase GTPBP3, mitochondrial [Macrosteles quadrilineatus]|uniref:tRNA modification GTPase GTPBP3, mitochondrial n=1 Tax=Macrosteles quadrilineatus TaxID=74068 RepID=UPI0023E1D0B3|nr:tRNA modification GTPase GTPBP3, mitochondrial [Macrosteles quadrilineatus]